MPGGTARRGGCKKEQQRRMIRSDSDTLMSLPDGGFIIRPVSCHYVPMQKLIRLLSSGGISISARCIALPPSSAPSTTKQGFPWGVLPMLIVPRVGDIPADDDKLIRITRVKRKENICLNPSRLLINVNPS